MTIPLAVVKQALCLLQAPHTSMAVRRVTIGMEISASQEVMKAPDGRTVPRDLNLGANLQQAVVAPIPIGITVAVTAGVRALIVEGVGQRQAIIAKD